LIAKFFGGYNVRFYSMEWDFGSFSVRDHSESYFERCLRIIQIDALGRIILKHSAIISILKLWQKFHLGVLLEGTIDSFYPNSSSMCRKVAVKNIWFSHGSVNQKLRYFLVFKIVFLGSLKTVHFSSELGRFQNFLQGGYATSLTRLTHWIPQKFP
jgi:hypothetical protein